MVAANAEKVDETLRWWRKEVSMTVSLQCRIDHHVIFVSQENTLAFS